MSAELIATLRESCPYMRDGGWHQTAALMAAAAEEIERLATEVRKLERRRCDVRSRVSFGRKLGDALHASSRWLGVRPAGPAMRARPSIELAAANRHHS